MHLVAEKAPRLLQARDLIIELRRDASEQDKHRVIARAQKKCPDIAEYLKRILE